MRALSRRTLLTGLAAAPFLPIVDASAGPLTYGLKPQRLADGVWMVAGVPEAITRQNGGAIANIAILDSTDGAIVIDTGPSRRFGVELETLARALTGKPVARVYITHFHPDHAFGNQGFAVDAIRAPAGVIDGLRAIGDSFANAMYQTAGDWMRGTEIVLPRIAAVDGIEDIGGRRLHLTVLKGHTNSDLVVVDEASGLMFAGDLVFLDRAPTTPHADLDQWRSSLMRLKELGHDRLMSGHGPVEAGGRGIAQTGEWIDVIERAIRDAFEKGLDMTEAFAVPLPAWTEKVALARYEFERSVAHLYPKLEAGLLPRVDKKG